MTARLEGKVALVTGAGSGIGQAAALAFAREGARVVLAGRNLARLDETRSLIASAGSEAMAVEADVVQAGQAEAMVRKAVDTYGHLDCAFNNAGGFYLLGGGPCPTADCSEEIWDRIVDVNLKGVWLCMKYELLQMVKQGTGIIVNNSSTDGVRGAPYMACYSAAKHGVLGLTRTAAVEYAPRGIRINAVCPGWIQTTPVAARIRDDPQALERILAQEPIGRLGTPAEVAEVVVWLCTQAASFLIGSAVAVDGGYTAV